MEKDIQPKSGPSVLPKKRTKLWQRIVAGTVAAVLMTAGSHLPIPAAQAGRKQER